MGSKDVIKWEGCTFFNPYAFVQKSLIKEFLNMRSALIAVVLGLVSIGANAGGLSEKWADTSGPSVQVVDAFSEGLTAYLEDNGLTFTRKLTGIPVSEALYYLQAFDGNLPIDMVYMDFSVLNKGEKKLSGTILVAVFGNEFNAFRAAKHSPYGEARYTQHVGRVAMFGTHGYEDGDDEGVMLPAIAEALTKSSKTYLYE